jgi:signal transduction histidine kinase
MFFERLSALVRPLSVRLTLWHSLLFLGSALALLALTYVLLRNRAYSVDRDIIEFRMNQYMGEYGSGGLDGIRRLAAYRKGRVQKAFFVRLGDKQNRTIYLRDAEDWAEFQPEQLAGQAVEDSTGFSWQSLRSPGGSELLIAEEILPDGGVLQVGKSNEELTELLSVFRRTGLIVLLVFVPASFAGGAFLASRALRPVNHLTEAARGIIQTSRFDARVPARGSNDELDALVRVFNEMLGRIDLLVRGMRDAMDNVAHDLRTPMTRLRHKAQGALEVDLDGTSEGACRNCQASSEALAECVEEADRVVTMLNTLMDITETESGLANLNVGSHSVAELFANVIESYSEFAADKSIKVTTSVSPDLRVEADAMGISRVLGNLLDNAIKYTPEGGRIYLEGARKGGQVELRVRDNGSGIPESDLPRIWDRLFRGDRSRTERGLGLGLSFVQAIVKAHGGSTHAESQPDAGTTITVRLPSMRGHVEARPVLEGTAG